MAISFSEAERCLSTLRARFRHQRSDEKPEYLASVAIALEYRDFEGEPRLARVLARYGFIDVEGEVAWEALSATMLASQAGLTWEEERMLRIAQEVSGAVVPLPDAAGSHHPLCPLSFSDTDTEPRQHVIAVRCRCDVVLRACAWQRDVDHFYVRRLRLSHPRVDLSGTTHYVGCWQSHVECALLLADQILEDIPVGIGRPTRSQ